MWIFRLVLMFFLFYSFVTYGQLNSQDTVLLNYAINRTNNSTVFYIDKSQGWGRISEKLVNNKFRGCTKLTQHNKISLSIKELKLLRQQIDLNKGHVWNDSLLINSHRIIQDSTMGFISKQFEIYKEKINNALLNHDTIAIQQIIKEKPRVYGFSKPLYLREETICLLYFVAFGDYSSGYDEIGFYKKENDLWTKWIVISQGDY